jgi:hypothetical protein
MSENADFTTPSTQPKCQSQDEKLPSFSTIPVEKQRRGGQTINGH